MNGFVLRVVTELGARIITKAAQFQQSKCNGTFPDPRRHRTAIGRDNRLYPARIHADDCWLRHGFLLPRRLETAPVFPEQAINLHAPPINLHARMMPEE